MLVTIWFLLWTLLWAVYFILDGFDLGSGTLMPFLARNDTEKRYIYNASGPFWDGNEVWLITAGGVTFAAFPLAYATMFSALYAPLLILLFALIFRAAAFEFRNKVQSDGWRRLWDICLVLGNFLPALLLGVAFANLFRGIPIDADLVFDVRFLPNPYYIAELKECTGLEEAVRAFLFGYRQTTEFMRHLEELFAFLLPQYVEEGKSSLVIAVGCTGGHHRSVAVAHALTEFIRQKGYRVEETHRDISR